MTIFTFNVIKIFLVSSFTAILALFLAPFLIKFLYKIKFWKKEARSKTITGEKAEVFYSLHKDREVSVPRGGGLIIWFSVLMVILIFYLGSKLFDIWWLKSLNFLSRGETWLPLFTLITASLVGLIDDILVVFGSPLHHNRDTKIRKTNLPNAKLLKSLAKIPVWCGGKGRYIAGGLAFKRRMLMVLSIGAIGAWWFYYKLGWDSIHIPLVGDFSLGIWYVLLFIVTILACWSSGVVDGIDGLAGGVFASIFGAFAIIAFSQGRVDLAAFCIAITGTLFAFLWFNIPPAKFYMGETGILGLTTTLAVVAFLTDSLIVLPIIGGLLVVESGSVILQLLSKKFRKKKIWLCTPIHHHFEAKGWPSYKVTMRFWIIGVVLAIIGTAIRLLG